MNVTAPDRTTGEPLDPRFDRLAEMTSMASEGPGGISGRPVRNGASTLNQGLSPKPRNRTAASVRTVVAKTVRELALRAEQGDRSAQLDLYRLHGTLRSQAARAKRALRLPRNAAQRESPEIGYAAARMIKGLADRAAEGDLMALHQLARLPGILREQTTRAARALHTPDAHGHAYSWREIGQAVGITMQGAEKRWGEKP